MYYQGTRIATRNRIKEILEAVFQLNGYNPEIIPTTYPINEAGNTELEKEAKAKGDNGVIFIGSDIIQYREKEGGMQERIEPYWIICYTNTMNDDELINNLVDLASTELQKYFTMNISHVCDVKGYKSGLYIGIIRIIAKPSF